MSLRGNIVKSGPSKGFFISMITRDISLIDAIIELIDNSIDGIKRLQKSDYTGFFIDVKIKPESFQIKDNCGGIEIDTARKYAFRFGRPASAPQSGIATTGTFGIGMKRALFKMGKSFKIDSTAIGSHFSLEIDVDAWSMDEENWDFSFETSDEDDHPSSECGTDIVVRNLYPGISTSFTSIPFINNVIQKLQQRASMEIQQGLQISVNDVIIEKKFVSIINSDQIKPYKESLNLGGVEVTIIAGIAPETNPSLAGWYIYCNGREIVAADKSSLTTWADGESVKYHNDYAAFRGFAFFNSNIPELLPWNTSKTGIDSSSNIYQSSQQHMKDAFKTVIGELKKIYTKEEDERSAILQDISSKPIIDINYFSTSSIVPNTVINFVDGYVLPTQQDPNVRISYTKPKSQVEALKVKMGVNSNKEVGVTAFEYYVEVEGIE